MPVVKPKPASPTVGRQGMDGVVLAGQTSTLKGTLPDAAVGITWEASQYGQALAFAGSTTCMVYRSNIPASLINGSTAFSLVAVAKSTMTGGGLIVGCSNYALGNNSSYLRFNAGKIELAHYASDNTFHSLVSSASYNDGNFHTIIGIKYGGDRFRLIVDDTDIETSPSPAWQALSGVDTFELGALARFGQNSQTNQLAGSVACGFLINRALSEIEILRYRNDPFWTVRQPSQVIRRQGFQPQWVAGLNQLIGAA